MNPQGQAEGTTPHSDAARRPAAAHRREELTLAVGSHAPREARVALAEWLDGHAPTHVVFDAKLVVSELVSNSVHHADASPGDVIRMGAELTDGRVLIEVEDAGGNGLVAPATPDGANGHGFGLNVVIAIAARWGVAHGRTTRVWAELQWPTSVVGDQL